MKVEILNQVDAEWWNQLVRQSPHGNIYQSYQWGTYLRENYNSDLFFLVCYDDHGEVAGALLLTRNALGYAHFFERPLYRQVVSVIKRMQPVFGWQYGPVLLGSTENWLTTLSLLFAEVARFIGKGALSSSSFPPGREEPAAVEVGKEFNLSRWGTFLIDLEKSEDELWNGLKSSARKSIKRAQKDGIGVEVVREGKGMDDFYDFLKSAVRLRNARAFSRDVLSLRHKFLSQIDGEDIYVAKWEDEIICSLGIWRFNGLLHEFGANTSEKSLARKLYGGDLLKWEIMCREKQKGARIYDLCGVNPNPSSEKEKGIIQFKKKWGGTYVEYPLLSRKGRGFLRG